ncbi:UDP:flavonoid glycosyltransferase YjiC, YdhE family [Nitrosomonas aestuarii]|uniref:UDP:flavonoid glycosyltransferase YjiC, YdhE family n=1 Tax=Nitrosomonas aestuarii TaxID=52441 RepID=A0A1I4FZM0_9PROT|nr:glycosyltransferase [Nitrosomonas aestuarii]SFL23342.1 UDP:flavonoid glycosyltransferase YjiC, YdhE family [Nitrosomonas aestuarii]
MRIGIQTWGSDGDILPFLALAEGLQAAGHQVTVAFTSVDNKDYSTISAKCGFQALKVFDRFEEGMDQAMTQIIATNDPLKQFILVMEKYFDPAVYDMYDASTQLCMDNEIVIGHMMNHTLLTAAEKYNRPRVVVALAPLAIRTKHIPLFGPNLGVLLNQITWRLGDYVGRKKLFSIANDIRNNEGLPPIKSLQRELYVSKDLTLIASSPSISIRQQDWGDNIQITGELNFKATDQKPSLPDDLEEFLNSGSAPIYITFGSISPYRAQETTELMLESVKKSGCRAIIQADWDNVHSVMEEDSIYKCNRLPHADVFPHCSLVVHHGGAGTTHTALRAGCPAIVVEHAFDQTFWGNELKRIGVAGKVLHRNSITAEQLAKAIKATLNSQEMKRNAMVIGEKMLAENGVETSVRLITERFETS